MTFIKTKSITRDEFAVQFKKATEEYLEKVQNLECVLPYSENVNTIEMTMNMKNKVVECYDCWVDRYEYDSIGDV